MVIKDLETAFAGYQRLVTQVNSIRTWTVTIMSASIALTLTNNAIVPGAVIGTAFVALAAFALLELRERSSMSFNKNEVVNLERIFMIRDVVVYNSEIDQYVFRDIRLGRIARREKVRHLVRSTKNWNIVLWYGFWSLALAVCLTAILCRW